MSKSRIARAVELMNRYVPWYKLPSSLGIANLIKVRNVLREHNLQDTWTTGSLRKRTENEKPDPAAVKHRTPDGSWNDLDYPDMGKAGTRFGRNSPIEGTWPDAEPALLEPSPREISRRLMTRDEFKPATTLNILAAAWIQFQTHDWFDHGQAPPGPDDFKIDLTPDDPWRQHQCPMHVPRTPADPTRGPADEGRPPTYVNRESHWWDGSCIYGSDLAKLARVREHVGGRLRVEKDGSLPLDPQTGRVSTGFNDNWWVGLGLLHSLFTLEHNAICNRVAAAHPDWDDERLFQTARLVVTAVLAKIHTIEWTPAITDHPTLHIAMNANWSGLASARVKTFLGELGKHEVLGGIRGTRANHDGAPFQLTEEFVSVYRLHPLIPDELIFRSVATDEVLRTATFHDVSLSRAVEFTGARAVTAADMWYSFGVAYPGAVCLHNFPRFLQDFTRPDGTRLDLAAVDILRDRERGVPRYNAFRRMIHMPAPTTFEELTDNPEWARELAEVYNGDIERVDLMVGMFAETPPPGFGFSDTAFRIFVLMASRRLRSDRFFTTDYTEETYSAEGLQWVEDNNMRTVLLRHYPELAPALQGKANAFAPWARVPEKAVAAR